MTVSDFVNESARSYSSISAMDSLVSSPLFLIAKIFLFVILAIILSFSAGFAGLRGWPFLAFFFLTFGIAIVLSINSFQKIERGSPIRKKIFNYRISEMAGFLKNDIKDVRQNKGSITIRISTHKHLLTIRYNKDLLINAGGILVGTPVAIPKGAHPKTYFYYVEGKTKKFRNTEVNFDFSARVDDKDPVNGFGVSLYKREKKLLGGHEHVKTESKAPEVLAFKNALQKAIKGTILKGELEFKKGDFFLRIFDNISKMGYTTGKIRFQEYEGHDRLKARGIAEAQMAIYGIEKLIKMI